MAPRQQASSSSSSDAQSSSSYQINFTTIIVSNLTPTIGEDHLKEIFSNFGQIQSLGIRQSNSKQNFNSHKRHAMINFSQQKDAQTAVQYMDDGWLDGLKIKVKMDNNNAQNPKKQQEERSLLKKQSSHPKGSTIQHNQVNDAKVQGIPPHENKKDDDQISQIEPKRKQKSRIKSPRRASRREQRSRNNNRRYERRSRSKNRQDRKQRSKKHIKRNNHQSSDSGSDRSSDSSKSSRRSSPRKNRRSRSSSSSSSSG